MTEPALLSLAIKPRTEADQERLALGLRALTAEDPTISAKTNPATGEVVVAVTGELQLEIVVDRLRREFNVEARLSRPLVAYRETLTRPADGEGRVERRVGGRSEYAHVRVRLYPGEPGSGYAFASELTGGGILQEFIKPIEEGIQEALARGFLAGYPVDDVRVVLYDGSYHANDSSELAFRIAGSMACMDAAKEAEPIVTEPVMRVEVMTPTEWMGDVIGDLTRRRGQIQSQDDWDGMRRIGARVPLSQMFGYASDLRSRTRGRGTFAMEFASYQPCEPPENQDTGDDSMVTVPRKPSPTLLDSSVALPEPTDEDGRE
jgi:elongation factor G